MAIFFDAPVSPEDVTTFTRNVPLPAGNKLSALFPRVEKDSNTYDFAEIIRTNRTAKYRSFDGRIHVSERDVGSEKRVKLAPLSSSIGMGEYERLQVEFAKTGGTNQRALVASIYNDAENLTNEVLNRMELAWGDVLTDGKLTISEGGLVTEADYGLPANHSVSAATSWATVATAQALSEIVSWVDTYVDTNGTKPGSILTSLKVQRLLLKNKEIIDAVYGSTQGRTHVTLPDLNTLLSSEGLPTILDTYDTKLDVDGTSTRVIADDKVLFLPDNLGDLGETVYGLTATALELVNSAQADLSFENAPGIVGVVVKDGPPFRQWTYVDAVGQPVLKDAKKLFVADVIA
ncbi:major capsid protein [Rhodococcus sp. NPDC057297]|uniref:major capsid protein n=1 Tax=Rhodococcus sp. NPDC057297 TaxID=3346090 RepID=UPI00362DD108